MGVKPMTYEEAARILDPETNLEALESYDGDGETLDCPSGNYQVFRRIAGEATDA